MGTKQRVSKYNLRAFYSPKSFARNGDAVPERNVVSKILANAFD